MNMTVRVISAFAICCVVFVSGCSKSGEVSESEFKEKYARTTEPVASSHWHHYLGRKDGYAYLNYGRMNYIMPGATNKIIRVKIADLDPVFAETIPDTELKEVPTIE